MRSRGSMLHLQLGQETIYLILAIAVFVALALAAQLRTAAEKEPPIIRLNEADGFYFKAGSAEVSPAFGERLTRQVIPRVRAIGQGARAEVVEVIGHTDEVPLTSWRRHAANLDETLMARFNGRPAAAPQAADNTGLGMARAVAVARMLRAAPELRAFQIMPLSAGAFELADDTMATGERAKDEQERRRIVIRVRRRVIS